MNVYSVLAGFNLTLVAWVVFTEYRMKQLHVRLQNAELSNKELQVRANVHSLNDDALKSVLASFLSGQTQSDS